LCAALLPSAAFASGYGNQGRAWDPGPRQHRGQHRPVRNYDNKHENKKHQVNRHSSRCDASYRVKHGDNLTKIAKRFDVSVHKLAKSNGIKNPNRILAGQVLCIR
jgi:LysM repeat protein